MKRTVTVPNPEKDRKLAAVLQQAVFEYEHREKELLAELAAIKGRLDILRNAVQVFGASGGILSTPPEAQ